MRTLNKQKAVPTGLRPPDCFLRSSGQSTEVCATDQQRRRILQRALSMLRATHRWQSTRSLRTASAQPKAQKLQADAETTRERQAIRSVGLAPIKCHSYLTPFVLPQVSLSWSALSATSLPRLRNVVANQKVPST